MKKIAVLLSGMPRNLDKVYKSHLNFFKKDGYEFDFFIHSWTDCWYKKQLKDNDETENDKDELISELSQIYKPKDIVVEDQQKNQTIIEDKKSLLNLCRLHETTNNKGKKICPLRYPLSTKDKTAGGLHFGQLYSLQSCCRLKYDYEEYHEFKYDYVIKSRLDLFYRDDIHDQFDEYINKIKPNQLLFKWMNIQCDGLLFCGDMHYIGNSEAIDKLCLDIYDYSLKRICREISGVESHRRSECGNFNIPHTPEAVIGERLLAKNMDAKLNMNFPNFFPYRHYHRDEQQDYSELYEKYRVEESGMWR